MRLPRLTRDDSAVTNRLLLDVSAAGGFDLISYVLIGGHAGTPRETGTDEHLNPVTNRKNPLLLLIEFGNDRPYSLTVSQVFRRTAADYQDCLVVVNIGIIETDIRLGLVSLPFNIRVPSRLKIVDHKVEAALVRRGYDRLVAGLKEAMICVERFVRLATVARDNKDLLAHTDSPSGPIHDDSNTGKCQEATDQIIPVGNRPVDSPAPEN